MKKALGLGILGSFFFAFTFILNRSMNLSGGFWMWSAVLRYVYTLPILAVILWKNHQMREILEEIRKRPGFWILWSTVGFGLFYAPLSLASTYGESWLIASTWQITIVAGVPFNKSPASAGRGGLLLPPDKLQSSTIPFKNLAMSCLILSGIFLMQSAHFRENSTENLAAVLIPIVIAAFSYPLGNRMTMDGCPKHLTSMQRIFGMTLCSMPFWAVCAVWAGTQSGLPSSDQHLQSFSGTFSGVIATWLFFYATDLVKHNARWLALIEATQSGEVVFTLLGGILLLGDAMPSAAGFAGIALILIGMTANSLAAGGR
ncbi:MAG: multidrug resistance efflux transporter family protein [Lachnospiraceae bacterium]